MKIGRRNMYATPEDATAYRGIYLDCSSYVNSIYYNLFGQDIIEAANVDTKSIDSYAKTEWAKGTSKASDVLYYVETTDYDVVNDATEIAALLEEIKSQLEIGDIICYRHGESSGSSGHVMIYVGDGNILHCTGSSFAENQTNPTAATDNATTIERTEGAIQLMNVDTVFTKSTNVRYLFNEGTNGASADASKKVWSFEVLRPLNKLSGIGYTLQRSTIPGLLIEKTSVSSNMSTVHRGDAITYTITLVNKGDAAINNIKVKDFIDNKCTYVNNSINNSGVVDGNNIVWNIASIAVDEEITLSYSVTVNNDAEIGSVIDSSSALINGNKTNDLYHVVGNSINYDTIKTNANAEIGQAYDSWRDFIYDAYDGVIASTVLDDYLISDTMVYGLIHTSNGYELNTEHAAYSITMPDFYGGRWVGFPEQNMIRLVKDNYMECGDIILTRYDDADSNKIYEAFLYLDSNTILKISNGGSVTDVVTKSVTADTVLMQLIGYKGFAILRPSLID